jgi:beta-lactam-binding protein with PASTA domain
VAEAAILAAGLTVGTVTTANSPSVPAGNVISQNPAAGTDVAPGSPVDLVVSLGPALVVVPGVTGRPQAVAETAILAAGLTVGTVTTANSPSVPAGNVISQNPAAGTNVAPGSPVDLVVSLGPAPVAVPGVTGQPQAVAEAAIVAAGLTVGTVTTTNSPTVPAGSVISQNPAAGTTVAPGTPVDLVVSLGPAPVAVPGVTGHPQAVAEATIVAAGLTVGTVTTANSPTVPAGNVISQNPAAGTNVAPGSPVNLVVSLGPSAVVRGDLDGDGCVGGNDVKVLLDDVRTGKTKLATEDINGDGVVNRADGRALMQIYTHPNGVCP